MKNFLRPILLFVIGNLFGIILAYIMNDGANTYDMPKIVYTSDMMLDTFLMIYINNTIVFLVCFFLLRVIFYVKNRLLKNEAVYSKVDAILYHVVNAIILFKTGAAAGYLVFTLSIETQQSFLGLYLKGIIPHGIIEMIPFMVVFHLNYVLIKNKQWNMPFHFKKQTLYILLFLILIAAVVESTITPFILF